MPCQQLPEIHFLTAEYMMQIGAAVVGTGRALAGFVNGARVRSGVGRASDISQHP